MALIKCKECGAAVSDSASVCPQCGAKAPRRTSVVTKLVAGLIVVGALGAMFGGSKQPTPPRVESAAEVAAKKAESERFDLARSLGKTLKNAARDPDSLKFRLLGVNDDATVVCAQYQAKNGFGGMNQEATIVVNMKAVQANDANWKKHCQGLKDYLYAAP